MKLIDQFLDNWKNEAKIWHMDKFEVYVEQVEHRVVLMEKFGYQTTRPGQELDPEWTDFIEKFDRWMDRIGKGMMGVLWNMLYTRNQSRLNPTKVTMDEWLEGHLDREVDRKKRQLISRIEKKAGTIVDGKGLYIANDLNINGVVVGDKETVNVRYDNGWWISYPMPSLPYPC